MTLALLSLLGPTSVDLGSPRENVEAAVIAKLDSLRRERGGYLQEVGHYNGQIDGASGPEDLKRRLLGLCPAILVTTGTSSSRERSLNRRRQEESYNVELLTVSNRPSSREMRTVGAPAPGEVSGDDPGIYRIMYDARLLLVKKTLGIGGVRRLRHISDTVVIQIDDLTAWRSLFEVRVQVVEEIEEDLGPFTSLEHRHNLEDSEPVNPVVVGEIIIDG